MRQFKTIFKFEYTNYVRTKGYIIITALMLAIILIVASLPVISGFVGNIAKSFTGSLEESSEGVTGAAQKKAVIADLQNDYTGETLVKYLPEYEWTYVDSISNVEEKIQGNELDLAVEIDGLNYVIYERNKGFDLVGESYVIVSMIKATFQENYLTERGISPKDALAVISAEPVGEVVSVGRDYLQSFWLSYVVIFLMYFVILLYGQFVTTSVVTEKSTKAMELLITSAKPFQLVLGKVMGVGTAGLTQFGAILLAALGFFRLNYTGWAEFSPMVASILDMSISGSLLVYAVLFFILGFFCFAFIYAGFASTVSRMEDANSVMMFPMLIFVAAFFVAIFGSTSPEAGFVSVCSFVPFLSPLVMFMRICVTADVPFVHILISIVINVATVLGAAFVCSRIYRVGVMLYGKKPNIKDIFRYIIKL